ncbi:hypothetical protein MNBD_PLANCTO02-341 [hydrothermal vent metagenome]|uniref:Uncharacterized protein n=1 Tax=hydrothermal vent metagenome TaxID=652676 RepID=A0A3B1DW70_9ZZZZ
MSCVTSEFSDTDSASVVPPQSFGYDLNDPVNHRPFVGSVDEYVHTNREWPETDGEIAAIQSLTGRVFTHCIVIAAMCNQTIDHQTLCWLLSVVATKYNGVVDFDMLDAPYSQLEMGKCEWRTDGQACWTVIGEPNACLRWLAHPRFRMVK